MSENNKVCTISHKDQAASLCFYYLGLASDLANNSLPQIIQEGKVAYICLGSGNTVEAFAFVKMLFPGNLTKSHRKRKHKITYSSFPPFVSI